MRETVEHNDGSLGVRITEDKYGVRISTSSNGFQWCGYPANDKLLMMMQCAITKFLNSKDKK